MESFPASDPPSYWARDTSSAVDAPAARLEDEGSDAGSSG